MLTVGETMFSSQMTLAKSRGFTLIELLVVMVLLGLLSSIAITTVGSGNQQRELRNEAERLHALLRMASEEAIISNTEIGAYIDTDHYAFLVFEEDEGKWDDAPQPYLRRRDLPEWALLEFEREGDEVKLGAQNNPDSNAKRPSLMLFSSGEVTPFRLSLEVEGDADSAIEITVNDQSEIELLGLNEDAS